MRRSPEAEEGTNSSARPSSNDAAPIAPLGPGMVARRLSVPSREVVFVKGILEAHDGLAQVYAERGGDLVVCTTASQAGELDAVLTGLARDIPTLIFGS